MVSLWKTHLPAAQGPGPNATASEPSHTGGGGNPHAIPHPPQFVGLLDVSTHAAAHDTSGEGHALGASVLASVLASCSRPLASSTERSEVDTFRLAASQHAARPNAHTSDHAAPEMIPVARDLMASFQA